MATALVIAVIVIFVVLAVVKMIKGRSKGKCAGCLYAGSCNKEKCEGEE